MELWLNRPIGPRWIVDVAEPLAINKHQLRLAVGKRRENMRGHFGKLNEGHDAKPPETTVSQVPTRILFAPDHSPEMEIMKQMLKATTRIDFAMFTFARDFRRTRTDFTPDPEDPGQPSTPAPAADAVDGATSEAPADVVSAR